MEIFTKQKYFISLQVYLIIVFRKENKKKSTKIQLIKIGLEKLFGLKLCGPGRASRMPTPGLNSCYYDINT